MRVLAEIATAVVLALVLGALAVFVAGAGVVVARIVLQFATGEELVLGAFLVLAMMGTSFLCVVATDGLFHSSDEEVDDGEV